ncbi:hypothetical protein [Alkalispirochaeta alkalica]|uniref:hypothetical protein n=1 Tax=Alkalispirochaeta alkalica TaxID=46356 RepID=UPI00037602E9|nr:hypothetical protein [Alkalispirochaeta alkalica]
MHRKINTSSTKCANMGRLLIEKIKDLIRLLRFFVYRLLPCRTLAFAHEARWLSFEQLSDGQNPTFFGYHDKTPFSGDNSRVLAMSVSGDDTRAETECTPIQLGFFRRADAPTNKPRDGNFGDFLPFAETTTWCWQQGCMLQWNPVEPNSQVVFNTLVNGRYGSVLFAIDQQSVVQEYEYPIYSLDSGFQYATTLNFSRLGRLRPGYGYALLPDATAGVAAPEDDGMFLMDLASGGRELIVRLADLAQEVPQPGAEHYVNHATFSPDGRYIVFFHLWSLEGDRGRGLRVLCYDIESRTHRIVEDQKTISHYCWRDSQTILATNCDAARTWRYTLYNVVSGDVQDLNLPLAQDGHPMFHPTNKSLIVTDTYPDRRRDQHLLLANIDTNEVWEIAALYSPWKYRGQVRCDLHPRWDRGGDMIVVDEVATKDGRILTDYHLQRSSLYNDQKTTKTGR